MEKPNVFVSASIHGILLALITIVINLLGLFFPNMGQVASIGLWIVKFVACIWALFYFMKSYSIKCNGASYGACFGYGVLVSMFSAIICACFTYLSVTVLFPETYEKGMTEFYDIIANMNLSSEQESSMEAISSKLPIISLFSTILLYTLYGVVFSAIIASVVKKPSDPFAEK